MVQRDAVLDEMIRALVARFDPDRIILFGSRARGDARADSDYDLVVEIDRAESAELLQAARAAVVTAAPDAGVDVHLRRAGDIEVRRDDPGYMEWDIAREGIVLYSSPSRPRRVREGDRPRAESSIPRWLEVARMDLLTIDSCLRGPEVPWGSVCFHAQQAAEKYLEAAIIAAGHRPRRTHDLGELATQLLETGATLPELGTECAALSVYAVGIRYPNVFITPDRGSGEEAVAAMRAIVDAVTPLLSAYLRPES